jgi:hypothetical protein
LLMIVAIAAVLAVVLAVPQTLLEVTDVSALIVRSRCCSLDAMFRTLSVAVLVARRSFASLGCWWSCGCRQTGGRHRHASLAERTLYCPRIGHFDHDPGPAVREPRQQNLSC